MALLSLDHTLRCWVKPSVVGSNPLLFTQTFHHLAKPPVVGSKPSVIGSEPSVVGFYPPLRRWVIPSAVGSYPPPLGHTLRRWVLPSIVGLCPSSLGPNLCCWVLPSTVTLCHWVVPSTIGSYPPLLGFTLRRWVLPSIVGLCPLSLGYALCRWALPLSSILSCHLACRHQYCLRVVRIDGSDLSFDVWGLASFSISGIGRLMSFDMAVWTRRLGFGDVVCKGGDGSLMGHTCR